MFTTVYLVRHADSIYTTDEMNRPISERGRLDAIELWRKFKDIDVHKVYSSPYKRAIQTVEGIALDKNLAINLIDDMRERKKIDGKLDNFQENVKKLWDNTSFKFIGGESNKEGQVRGVNAITNLLRENDGKSIVIGTHGDIMTLILNYYDNSYGYEFWKALDMPDAYKLTFSNEKICNIEKVWNRTPRLTKHGFDVLMGCVR